MPKDTYSENLVYIICADFVSMLMDPITYASDALKAMAAGTVGL